MYSFEGDFRRKPEQNLAGASRKEQRDELLNRAQVERFRREECRRREKSTLCIQSYVRSFLTRQTQKNLQRAEFDLIAKETVIDDPTLTLLVKKLLFFYHPSEDISRLITVCQLVLKEWYRLLPVTVQDNLWQLRIIRLLHACLMLLGPSLNQDLVSTPLRMLEVYTSMDLLRNHRLIEEERAVSYLIPTLTYLLNNGYIARMYSLLEYIYPPAARIMPNPNMILGKSAMDLIIQPISLVKRIDNMDFSYLVMEKTMTELLCVEHTELFTMYVLPKIVYSHIPKNIFLQTIVDRPIPMTPWLMYTFLLMFEGFVFTEREEIVGYLQAMAEFTKNFNRLHLTQSIDSDDDSDSEDNPSNMSERTEVKILEQCVIKFNEVHTVENVLNAIDDAMDSESLEALCQLCHNLLLLQKLYSHTHRFIYYLAIKPNWLEHLWSMILSATQSTIFGTPTPLLNMIARGITMTEQETNRIVPLLATFCSLFSLLISTLHDGEFYKDDVAPDRHMGTMPFSLASLVTMTSRLKEVTLGLVELAFPESRPSVNDQYRSVVGSDTTSNVSTIIWSHLFKACVSLLRQLYVRDLRRPFCPEGHWISENVTMSLILDRPSDATLQRSSRLRQHYQPFHFVPTFTREELEEGPPPSTREVRMLTILREIPFVAAFQERVVVFQNLVMKDKMAHQSSARNFLHGPSINVIIRRNYLYEDAFEKLSPENEPEMRLMMRVQLVSAIGLDEVGIDGGGVFREFLTELLKSAFDPNRGFFRLTKDNLLYPNPHVHLLHYNHLQHYFFIGRMLGKALYENLLVELPLAEFFLSKIVSRHSNVDMHHLDSLDPVMYRSLLYLKNYEGDVTDLGLDFTVVHDELGETKVDELKPGGANISVTAANRIEYIHLVADYKLNKQIKNQCMYFKEGLANVVPLEWIRMFSYKEFQVLVSGAEIPVDITDLQLYTNYSGGFSPEHPTIKMFWSAVIDFNDIQKRQLLKFVTSCSRPPLLGFKELDPPFCIQSAGPSDRLPTASTCMNLLKLPEFDTKPQMKEKLLYAIQSGSGFELS